ncbi:MAG TPA: ThuA domain-containing protein [Phnomibacter sp.]|nr:ThuA domain-containing protein [Phnomibacter sp.]
MKGIWAGLLSLLLLGIGEAKAQSLKHKKILVFSKTVGFRHASIANGKEMFLEIAGSEKFKADTTEDATVFNAKNLKQYDVVVFMNTTMDVLNAEQQQAFQDFIRSGKSFLGIHAASDTEYEWPWYNKLVGAYFVSHPKPQKASYINLDSLNPATTLFPTVFTRFEEIYNFKSLQKDILHFVLAVDETSYTGGTMPDFHPMAWCHAFDGGKAFYTALGHHPETYTDPEFRQHILGALRWLLTK